MSILGALERVTPEIAQRLKTQSATWHLPEERFRPGQTGAYLPDAHFLNTLEKTGLDDLNQVTALEKALSPMSEEEEDAIGYESLIPEHLRPTPPTPLRQAPLVGMGPLVSVANETATATAEAIQNALYKLANAYEDEGGHDALRKLTSVEIGHPIALPGGSMDSDGTVLRVAPAAWEWTLPHEFRHLLDQHNNPEIFADYPYYATGVRSPEYMRHPSEIRAEGTALTTNLLNTAEAAKQGTFPRSFIEPLARLTKGYDRELELDERVPQYSKFVTQRRQWPSPPWRGTQGATQLAFDF